MKKMRKQFIALLITIFIFVSMQQAIAAPQTPGGHGASSNQTAGGGAPIGSGLIFLLGMAGAYGGFKAYKFLKSDRVAE